MTIRIKPLAIDLYAGLGGWAEGLLAEGWEVIGFDIERHQYGEHRYPAQLVIQDVRTLHGSQFRDAGLLVASPPCQEYSYMAMPWSRGRAIAAEYRAGKRNVAKLTELFDACFRLQCEASEAAGRHIPMVVENVRGAIPWVGRSRWNYGSFHLWGDVPALMPQIHARKQPGQDWDRYKRSGEVSPHWRMEAIKVPGFRFDGSGRSFQTASVDGVKLGNSPGRIWSDRPVADFDDPLHGAFHRRGSGTAARKAASALIAKIPLPLSRHIARSFLPRSDLMAAE